MFSMRLLDHREYDSSVTVREGRTRGLFALMAQYQVGEGGPFSRFGDLSENHDQCVPLSGRLAKPAGNWKFFVFHE